MSDCGNCKVKMFSRSMELLSSLKMTDGPWAIALVDDDEVVVSVSAETIIILDISNNSIQLKRTKELTFKVDGIAAYKDKLIIGSLSFPFSVKMIDQYSKICWSVSSDERGFSLFRYPSYVTIASNNYEGSRSSSATITDYGIKAITLLNSDTGTIKSRREVLAKRPKGVTCDIAGIVFVCYSNVSEVEALTENLAGERLLITEQDGLGGPPRAVMYDEQMNQLFVSNDSKASSNFVDCFQISKN